MLRRRDFCLRAVREAGVAAIPISSLYAEALERHIIRLCFAKPDESLARAATALSGLIS